MKSSLAPSLLSVALLFTVAVDATAKEKKPPKADVIMPADSMKWEDGPLKGTHAAKITGDWMKGGAYSMFVKFDAGIMNPMHHHTQTLKIVVVSGEFVHQPKGGKEQKLGPGSYLEQVGGMDHISGCAAGADCVFFMTSKDKFDLVPTK